MIESGQIKTFDQIFVYVRKRQIYKAIGLNHGTFQRRLDRPGRMRLEELVAIAKILECEPVQIFNMFLKKIGKIK